jgi:RNA polymerase sigma factor (TIGR02999 family)
MSGGPGEVTQLLIEFGRGDAAALERLMPLVYDELHQLARSHRYRWSGHEATPGTTSIVHEAYLRLVDQDHVDWRSRSQFYCIASRAMRSVLIDNARAHGAQKRGGDRRRVSADDAVLVSRERSQELIDLDEALTRLAAADEELGNVVECRFFGGLTIEETAAAMSMSPATVKRRWSLAQAWLYKELKGS